LGEFSHHSQTNTKSIVDWDNVAAVPLKLSALSIEESFWEAPEVKLDRKQARLFQSELNRIERKKSFSTEWSQMFQQSKENEFLFDILRSGCDIADLRWKYREFLTEALHRSQETIKQAASEWEAFVDEFFRNKGRVIPDWPQYVEIQEGVGIYGPWRRLKRRALKWWNVLWDELRQNGRK